MVDRHEEFRTWSLLAAISPEPSVRAGAEYALALFRDYDALAADITSMQMAYEAAHEQAHQMRERAIAAEARLAEAEAACRLLVEWDDAENNAKPFADDNGAAFYARVELCRRAMAAARAVVTNTVTVSEVKP